MNARKHNLVHVLATGTVVVVLMSIGLFWARWFCTMARADLLPPSAHKVTVAIPPGMLGVPTGDDPNLTTRLAIEAELPRYGFDPVGLGVLRYVDRQLEGDLFWRGRRYDREMDDLHLYYDGRLGQIVYQMSRDWEQEDGTRTLRHFPRYAGPKGVGDAPDKKLGRFIAPVMDRSELGPQIVYDGALRRFFAVDWYGRTVRQGPKLADGDRHNPVQIRVLWRNPMSIRLVWPVWWSVPQIDRAVALGARLAREDPVLILDASGRIELLDPQTLQYTGLVGHLVRLVSPTPVFGRARETRPADLLSYYVLPINVSRDHSGKNWTCGGWAVATILREGLAMRLSVYDASGQFIGGDETRVPEYVEDARGEIVPERSMPSAKAAYCYLPGAQVLTLAKFMLENLHPPVLLLLSYLAGPYLEAPAGYRSILLLPDSLVAMSARDVGAGWVKRVSRAFLLGLPALLLSLLLAWRTACDGGRIGLSKDTRTAWFAGMVAFGLPAYLTYRLTRPKVALVTCANCGLGRRPDLEKCHHCGSAWVVPELTPPLWRVVEAPEQPCDQAPAETPETAAEVE